MKIYRILVLEEEAIIAENVRICLKDAGYEVHVSSLLSDALQQLSKLNPDLVIIGVVSKHGYDEVEAAVQIKSLASNPLKFIFLVSRPISVANRKMNYQVLQKPFSDEELLEIVKAQLQS